MAGNGWKCSATSEKGNTKMTRLVTRTYKLPEDLIKQMEQRSANRSQYVRQAIIEKLAREQSTDSDSMIIVKAKERTAVDNEITSLESDPTFVQARQQLRMVEKPLFLKSVEKFGAAQVVPTQSRKDADYFVHETRGRVPIDEYDSLVKERAVNRKIVESYEARMTKLRERLSKLEQELSRLCTI